MNEEITKEENKGSIKKGVGLVVLAHIIYCTICFIPVFKASGKSGEDSLLTLIGICCIPLIQFIYVIPLAIYFRKEKETLKGILITSGITFLSFILYLGYSFFTFSSDPTCSKYYCKNKVIYEKNKNPSQILDFNKSNKIEIDCCEKLAKVSTKYCREVSFILPFKNEKRKISKLLLINDKQKELLSCKVEPEADPVIEMEKIGINFDWESTITKANGIQEIYIDVFPKEEVKYYRCSSTQPLQKEECKEK